MRKTLKSYVILFLLTLFFGCKESHFVQEKNIEVGGNIIRYGLSTQDISLLSDDDIWVGEPVYFLLKANLKKGVKLELISNNLPLKDYFLRHYFLDKKKSYFVGELIYLKAGTYKIDSLAIELTFLSGEKSKINLEPLFCVVLNPINIDKNNPQALINGAQKLNGPLPFVFNHLTILITVLATGVVILIAILLFCFYIYRRKNANKFKLKAFLNSLNSALVEVQNSAILNKNQKELLLLYNSINRLVKLLNQNKIKENQTLFKSLYNFLEPLLFSHSQVSVAQSDKNSFVTNYQRVLKLLEDQTFNRGNKNEL